MKKILFIIVIFCFGHLSAQEPNTNRTITQVNNSAQVNYAGSVSVFNDKEIEGNRFLFPNWQNQGQIYYKGAVFSVDNINFDISTNEFSQMKKQDSIFVFHNSKIDSVKVNNRLLKPNNTGKFSEILSEGKKLNLIKSYDVEIIEGMYSPVYGKQKTYRYKIVTSYYAVQNGIPRKVYLNKKNVTDLFGSEKSVMEKYIEDNKLSYKDESDMIRACNYFNTI